jgi:cytochrome c oxidase assembly protein subunit 15
LAILAAIVGYFVLLMGSLVTTTGSGQGCGNSWPFCHGQIIPGTITVAGIIEYSHRVMSSVDGLLVLVLAIGAWFLYKKDFRARLFGILSLFFVILQGALGALTVVYEGTFVKTWLLSVHFGLSLIAFASALLLAIRLFQIDRGQRSGIERNEDNRRVALERLQYPVWGLAIYTYIVVYTGALVEHAGALMACGYQVPGCGSTYLPNLTSTAGIQVLHRYAASSLWILVLALLIVVTRRYSQQRDIVRGAAWAFVLITLQAISGVAQVLTGGQMIAILSHTTIISVFFAVLCYLCMQVGWPWHRKRQVRQSVDEQLELNPVP